MCTIRVGGGVVLIADADFPGASSADYQDGYGLFSEPASNQWFFSDQFDFTALTHWTSTPRRVGLTISFP